MTGVDEGELPPFAIVNCISVLDHEHLLDVLRSKGFSLLSLDGTRVTDKASLLRQVDEAFPRPPDLNAHNWDALSDVTFNSLLGLRQPLVALVWPHVDRIVGSDMQDFVDALRILTDAVRDVMDNTATTDQPMTVLIFLLGEGSAYRRLG